ncbi:hypothetical protein FH972_014724 [Carpinus fangiana]|uniref:Uncharacterized protein n=1 Tax=Carpinus fangiana TaxID=176857 RepID=A0A5N6RE72_9ROSI|nr:hypothetical protein FH972_014724 [Carpinus fangiana]
MEQRTSGNENWQESDEKDRIRCDPIPSEEESVASVTRFDVAHTAYATPSSMGPISKKPKCASRTIYEPTSPDLPTSMA